MKVQKSIISRKEMKLTTFEVFAHSNKVWMKKSFNSWIDLSSPSKYVYSLPSIWLIFNGHNGDHTPKHLSFGSVKLLWPTSYKFHHTTMYVGPCNRISKIMLGLSPSDVECWLYTLLIVIVTKQKTYFLSKLESFLKIWFDTLCVFDIFFPLFVKLSSLLKERKQIVKNGISNWILFHMAAQVSISSLLCTWILSFSKQFLEKIELVIQLVHE